MYDPADYTVGFVRIGDEGRALLGSGTLVATPNQCAIVTAGSVLSRLPTRGRLGIALRTDLNQISLDTGDLEYQSVSIAGVVLGLIRLSAEAARRLDETKHFVELRLKAQESADNDPAWLVNGFSSELTTTGLPLDCFDLVVGYTNVTGLPERSVSAGLEQIELRVRGVSEIGEPLALDGLIGGGLWRSLTGRDGVDIVLSGVVLSAPSGIAGPVRCAGPTALKAVLDALEG